MAFGSSVVIKDVSGERRKFPKELYGDFCADELQLFRRQGWFQSRNMTRLLASHEKSRLHLAKSRACNNTRTTTDSGQNVASNNTGDISSTSGVQANEIAQVNSQSQDPDSHGCDSIVNEHDTSMPAHDAVSQNTLQVKRQGKAWDPNAKRISTRQRQIHQEDDPNAVLCINVCNVRKKLNWKSNKPSESSRPRKRARLESTTCDAFLTVWDNSPGVQQCEPLFWGKRICEVVQTSDADAPGGLCIELELAQPFLVPKVDLKVSDRSSDTAGRMAQQYFVEFKLIPRGKPQNWPPIPILGPTSGEQMTKQDNTIDYKLQNSLIARLYQLTPDATAPLSLFFYYEGVSYRTKYGLEVDAKWQSRDEIQTMLPTATTEASSELEPWMVDEEGRPFGLFDPNKKLDLRSPAAEAVVPSPTAMKKTSRPNAARKTTQQPRKGNGKFSTVTKAVPEVAYQFHVSNSSGSKKEFREARVKGLVCPSCSSKSYKALEQLHLHLRLFHHKYTWNIQSKETTKSNISRITIRVAESRISKHKIREEDTNDKTFSWIAPIEPFDIGQLTSQNEPSWLSRDEHEDSIGPTRRSKHAESSTVLRRQHRGFLSHEHVQPVRPKAYTRKKIPWPRLLVSDPARSAPYTSISTRAIAVEDPEEGPASESDDEADDRWFTARSMEEQDIFAHDHSWSDAERRLAKKWTYHILTREHLPHGRYISDSLIRFVRIEKNWILRISEQWRDTENRHKLEAESMNALMQLLIQLKDSGTINQSVCDDVLMILMADDGAITIPDDERREALAQERDVLDRKGHAAQYASLIQQLDYTHLDTSEVPRALDTLPDDVCAICQHAIGHHNERAVRCSDRDCSFPFVYYHADCAGLDLHEIARQSISTAHSIQSTTASIQDRFMKERLSWRCPSCSLLKDRLEAWSMSGT